MCYEMISVKSLQKIIKIIWENDEDKLKIQEEKFNQYSLIALLCLLNISHPIKSRRITVRKQTKEYQCTVRD